MSEIKWTPLLKDLRRINRLMRHATRLVGTPHMRNCIRSQGRDLDKELREDIAMVGHIATYLVEQLKIRRLKP